MIISFINIRSRKFCSTCGKQGVNQTLFSPTKFCSKCGEEFEQ